MGIPKVILDRSVINVKVERWKRVTFYPTVFVDCFRFGFRLFVRQGINKNKFTKIDLTFDIYYLENIDMHMRVTGNVSKRYC